MRLMLLFLLLFGVLEANVNIVCKAGSMDATSAKKYIKKFLASQPDNIECIIKLADIYLKSGELLQGYKLVTQAYNVNPYAVEHSSISNILPYAMKMTKLEERAKQNNDVNLWNKLGNIFFDMGIYGESISAYKNSLALDENQVDVSLKLALCYKKSNKIDKAIEQLKTLISHNSENFYANYYIGKLLLYSQRDEQSAKKHLMDAQKILISSKGNFTAKEYPYFMKDITLELGK